MKIKNLSTTKTLEFNDLGSHMKGVSMTIRSINLKPSTSQYLLDTSEVLLSNQEGDIKRFAAAGLLEVDDTLSATTVITHNLGVAPKLQVLLQAGATWVEAVNGTDYTAVHNAAFTTLTFTVITAGTYKVHLG